MGSERVIRRMEGERQRKQSRKMLQVWCRQDMNERRMKGRERERERERAREREYPRPLFRKLGNTNSLSEIATPLSNLLPARMKDERAEEISRRGHSGN